MRRTGAVVAGASVIALGTGVAVASIPDSGTGLIHGCYSKTSGALRVIDASKQHCKTGEAGLTWNQRGVNWRGAWSSKQTYAKNDAVSFGGSSFLAKAANTNVTPKAGTTWAVLAQAGATGATGPTGPAGADGAQGPQGTPGPSPVTGRVVGADFSWSQVVGAPSGLTPAASTNAGQFSGLTPDAPVTFTHLAVSLSAAAPADTYVGIADASVIQLYCLVPAGQTSCTSDASYTFPANSPLQLAALPLGGSGSFDISFGYQAVQPSGLLKPTQAHGISLHQS